MSRTTTTSFFSWRGAFQIALAVAAFFMVDPYIRKLLSFVQEHCIAELSPHWFGASVCLFVACCCYILCRRYKNTYIPVQLRWGLLLLAAAYLYYRLSPCYYYRLSPEFYFWRVPIGDCTVFRATWTDLLFLPWLYVMGGRGVLRYLSSNRRCMRMLRVFWMRRIWSKPMRLYKKTVEVELCNLILKQARRCARKLRVLWTRRIWSKLKRLCEQKVEVTRQETKMTSSSLSNPIHCAEDDELDFNPKVSELAKELRGLDLKERSTCYGIIAPWGYGKTSFLNLLSTELSADGIVVTFNPRSAKSVEHIQEDFFVKLAQELSRYYWGASLIVTRYAEQIGLLNNFSKARLLADALRLLRFRGSKATVNNAIEKIGKRLYIFLDDLDRLEGKELLETIKLIDVNADFKNTVFLVACDKKYANDVLQEYLGVNPSQGYLDKYITREVHLSSYVEEKLAEVMVKSLEEKLGDGELITKQVVLEGWHGIAPYIVSHLGSMRHLKRYQEIFISDYCPPIYPGYTVQDYVDPVDFFLLTLLKYKDRGVYDAIKSRICFDNDGPFYSTNPEGRWERWHPSRRSSIRKKSSSALEQEPYPTSEDWLDYIVHDSQWEAAFEVVHMLFPQGYRNRQFSPSQKGAQEMRNSYYLYFPLIRYRRGFTSYFPDLEDYDRDDWHRDVLELVHYKNIECACKVLNRRWVGRDRQEIIRLLLLLTESNLFPIETCSRALKLVVYAVDRYDNEELKSSLQFRFMQRPRTYSEDGRSLDGSYSREEVEKLVDYMVENFPKVAYDCFRPVRIASSGPYAYTQETAGQYLLEVLSSCLTQYGILLQRSGYSYSDGLVDFSYLNQIESCRKTVSGLFGLDTMFCNMAARKFTSWVKEHPQQSIWLFLSETDRCSLPVKFNTNLKQAMEENGLSVEEWIEMMDTFETKEVLRVIAEDRDAPIEGHPTNTPRKHMCIPYIHEAFVRSGLIHLGSED